MSGFIYHKTQDKLNTLWTLSLDASFLDIIVLFSQNTPLCGHQSSVTSWFRRWKTFGSNAFVWFLFSTGAQVAHPPCLRRAKLYLPQSGRNTKQFLSLQLIWCNVSQDVNFIRMGKKKCTRQTIIFVQRCNAVKFEGNVCEEAKVTALEEIESGQTETRFLIRSENAKYNSNSV